LDESRCRQNDDAPEGCTIIDGRCIIVGKSTLARMFGLTAYSVRQLIEAGGPVYERGRRDKPWLFDSVLWFEFMSTQWQKEHKSEYRTAQIRHMTARAIAAEKRNAEIESVTIPIGEYIAARREENETIRRALRKVPAAIVKAVPPGATREDVERIASDAINDALVELHDDAQRILAESK
jgi:phage terminase Nu1 subunit (DNA packaging protein)